MEITQGTCNYQLPVFCLSFHTQNNTTFPKLDIFVFSVNTLGRHILSGSNGESYNKSLVL